MNEETAVSTPAVQEPAAPQISEAEAQVMPMDQLRRVAIEGAAPESATPAPQPDTQQPEIYSLNTTPEGVEIKLVTGERFVGKDINEVLPKLIKSKVDTTMWARNLKKWGDESFANGLPSNPMPEDPNAAAMAAQQAEQAAQAQQIQQDALRQWFSENVLTPEMKKSIVAETLGVAPEALPQVYNEINTTWREGRLNAALMEFRTSCPDYIDTPENVAAMTAALDHFPQDYVPSADDLTAAWARALYAGAARPYVQQQQRRVAPPPPMPGGVSSGVNTPDPWKMDKNELRKLAGIG